MFLRVTFDTTIGQQSVKFAGVRAAPQRALSVFENGYQLPVGKFLRLISQINKMKLRSAIRRRFKPIQTFARRAPDRSRLVFQQGGESYGLLSRIVNGEHRRFRLRSAECGVRIDMTMILHSEIRIPQSAARRIEAAQS